MATGGVEIFGGVHSVAKGTGGEPRQLASVAVGKGNYNAIGRETEAGERIGGEARLGLFAVADDRGSGLFEPLDRVAKRTCVSVVECLLRDLTRLERCYGLK